MQGQCKFKAIGIFSSKSLTLVSVFFVCLFVFFDSQANFVAPEKVDLINAPLDSTQQTLWKTFPIIIHRRTPAQIKAIENSFDHTSSKAQRFLSYQSIARTQGHEFASSIMAFTESYISNKNVYMSEKPEFGIYSQVSPILGCSIYKAEQVFIDPCFNVKFDFAGRVKDHSGYQHLRLTIPPHRIVKGKLEFIEDYRPAQIVDFTPNILNMDVSDIEKALLAIDFERLDILKQVVAQNPTVLSQKNTAGSSAIQLAAFHDTTLDYLLTFESININHVNNAGYTALMFAVWNRKLDNAKKLIAFGATPQAFTYNGKHVPSIYDFLINEYLFDDETAKEIYEGLLEAESASEGRLITKPTPQ